MKLVSALAPVATLVRLLVLAVSLTAAAAHADEYSDVTEMIRGGRLEDAQARIDAHLTKKPRDPQMRYFKGMVQQASGQALDALATFTKLTEDFPELPEPFNAVAVIHAARGEYEKARLALEQAVRVNPSYATAHENLADIYVRLASLAYCKAIELDGGNDSPRTKLSALHVECP